VLLSFAQFEREVTGERIRDKIAASKKNEETKLVLPGLVQQKHSSRCDPALIEAIARRRVWFEELATGRARSLQDLAKRDGITRRYIRCLVGLAFVSPQLVEAILQGRQPVELTATRLTELDLPLDWTEQHTLSQVKPQVRTDMPEAAASPRLRVVATGLSFPEEVGLYQCPSEKNGQGAPVRGLRVPSHVPATRRPPPKVRAFSPTAPGFTAETDSALEETDLPPMIKRKKRVNNPAGHRRGAVPPGQA
jgi:hypothetical protein